LKLWDFGMMESGKIKITPKIGDPLGLVNGSEVFSSMFRYEIGGKSSYEIVLSPFGPENYRELAYLTFHVRDEPGALAQAAQFLKTRNIDILNSETISSIPNVIMIWEMLADLSFYGDSLSLKKEFDDGKSSGDASIDKVDCVCVEGSDLATRYTRGVAVADDKVKTKALRKIEKKASVIEKGVFNLPNAYVNFLGKDSGPVMLIGDPESWILSIAFLNDDSELHRIKIDLPDRPGALFDITRVLGSLAVNVLAGYTNVLVYYEKMTCELVVDVGRAPAGVKEDLGKALRKEVENLGPMFRLAEAERVQY